jgi:hypothetical protein
MDIDYNQIARVYIKMRDKRSDIKKEFEAADKVIKDQMELLEGVMLSALAENGAEGIKTSVGTIYREEKITPTGSDWDTFYEWISQHDAFDALERRIKKTFVTEYMEAHDGSLPPGVSVFREYVARVRRK